MGKAKKYKIVSPDKKIWYGTFRSREIGMKYMKDNYPDVDYIGSEFLDPRGLNWIKLTDDNIPKDEVLAIGYRSEMRIGFIKGNEDDAVGFRCEDDNGNDITEVSHFITCADLIELL